MTPEGHALSAWITFSAFRDGDTTIAQAQALERTADPFVELAFVLGGSRQNDRFWEQTLTNVAVSVGVSEPVVTVQKSASTGGASGATLATCGSAPPLRWPSLRSRAPRGGCVAAARLRLLRTSAQGASDGTVALLRSSRTVRQGRRRPSTRSRGDDEGHRLHVRHPTKDL